MYIEYVSSRYGPVTITHGLSREMTRSVVVTMLLIVVGLTPLLSNAAVPRSTFKLLSFRGVYVMMVV